MRYELEIANGFAPPPESAIYVVAERTEVKPFRWPVQRKYRGMLKS